MLGQERVITVRKKKKRWTPRPEMTAPVDPQEFKFCCALMNAGYSGQMPTDSPSKQSVDIEGVGVVSFTDIPMNRAMLAVKDHFRETRKGKGQDEFIPMAFRLMCFSDFLRLCLKRKEPRLERFVQRGDGGKIIGVEETLLEAVATAKIGQGGFSPKEVFAKTAQLMNEV